MGGSLIILLFIWILMGLGLGYYADSIFKGDRPYGISGDLVAGVLSSVAVGLMDWFVAPRLFPNFGNALIFLAAILEPLVSILLVLWLMRYIKR